MEEKIETRLDAKETPVEFLPRIEKIVSAPIIDSIEEDKTYESEVSPFKNPSVERNQIERNQIESYDIKTLSDTNRIHGKPLFEFTNREGMKDKHQICDEVELIEKYKGKFPNREVIELGS